MKQSRKSIRRAPKCGTKRCHRQCDRPAIQNLPRLTPEQIATALGDQQPSGPGAGYRLLTRGEIIRQGDEWNHPTKGWMPCTLFGRPANHQPDNFRRKLEIKPFFGPFLIVNKDGLKWSLNTPEEVQAALWGRDMVQHDIWVRVDGLPADLDKTADVLDWLRRAAIEGSKAVSESDKRVSLIIDCGTRL